ncbi:MAG: D-alanine--D-alanine ligase [Clostridia bacterium]|nr:D-alanine--D-alanine ligase [Clostridia bacterium]
MNNAETKTNVALIFGGRGQEHNISVKSAKFIYPLIDRDLFRVYPVLISKTGRWLLCGECDLLPKREVYPAITRCGGALVAKDELIPIGCAFPVLHGDFGEDGTVTGALESAGIKYVGPGVRAGAITSDKIYTKIVAEHLGIPTAKWVCGKGEATSELIDTVRERAEAAFGYPMFIKPSRLGSSIGASVARSRRDFATSYKKAAELCDGVVIVEELVDIDFELECAYFGTKSKQIFTNPGQIKSGSDFYDYESKYVLNTASVSAEGVSRDIAERINGYARRLCGFLEIRHLSRFDFFLTKSKDILFNEINTIPGFTEISLYPKLISLAGISGRELVNTLITDALSN